ncbi:MAG: hypothetical protein RJB66_2083 [Pseudomonadota bacterium]|jgi:5-methyltetrahydrofolate--homocysteine methyltransferase
MNSKNSGLRELLKNRIVFLDGAFGTMVQTYQLKESDYRGDRFANHPSDLKGNNDLLCITRPELIKEIHRRYLEAGADIIETNSFNGTVISQSDYGLQDHVYEMNFNSARLAKEAVLEYQKSHSRPCFVAGAIGPTNKTLSLSPKVTDPGFREVSFDEMVKNYYDQVAALVAGGVDLLLPETSFDTLNMKACIYAIKKFEEDTGIHKDLILSVTITDQSGRTLSGQTVEAFWNSVRHAKPLAVGMNCALGAKEMRPFLAELSKIADCYVSCYPNAGLPNPLSPTGYDETPEMLATTLLDFAKEGWLNIVGGCCGTTPPHIKRIVEELAPVVPRAIPLLASQTRLAGLESLNISSYGDKTFLMVGERTNVTGSPVFARYIKEGNFEAAIEVARQQVLNGANIIDINFDEGLIDSEASMERFLKLVAAEPDITRVPIMIDSSKWSVLETGLKCLQGKGIVNSLSLKEGVEAFKKQARILQKFGAAAVVMAFDEQGQAVELEHKVSICERVYKIWVDELGFDPCDLIFDPNVLTIGTGIEEHNNYALNFIEAVAQIKSCCPGALTSGGISNVSFSFRGQNHIREAMHCVFLYYGIQNGLDMGIVNAGMLGIYDQLDSELRNKIENLVLNRSPRATEDLLAWAQTHRPLEKKDSAPEESSQWRFAAVEERLRLALIKGIDAHINEDVLEALEKYKTPLSVIEGPLMEGMKAVGALFGAGKMFLPQVVKTARVMKKAVGVLEPLMEKAKAESAQQKQGTFLIATVKGDVHDIGKNIVSVVLACNGYRVIDLGVMVSWDKIIAEAQKNEADFIGLSGLITPSLEEMIHNASQLEKSNLKIPLLIGGATTSSVHTAVKIAPHYSGPVVHVADASLVVDVCNQLSKIDTRKEYIENLKARQNLIRESFEKSKLEAEPLLTIEQARDRRFIGDDVSYLPPTPDFLGIKRYEDLSVKSLIPYIDWSPFFWAWELKGVYPYLLQHPDRGAEAKKLHEEALVLLNEIADGELFKPKAVLGFWKAYSNRETIYLWDKTKEPSIEEFTFLRQQKEKEICYSLADFIVPAESEKIDFLGAFAVTVGAEVEDLAKTYEREGDTYKALMVKALGDRLAEAATEYMHKKAREHWGYGVGENLSNDDLISEKYRGIRPAPGYPACPDHRHKQKIWKLLQVESSIGATLTESCAIYPPSSVSGFYFSHPKAKYFHVGRIGEDQLTSFGEQSHSEREFNRRWLAPNL